MGKVMSSIMGGGAPKVAGPDPELIAAQKRQAERADRQDENSRRAQSASLRASIGSRSGRRQLMSAGREDKQSTLG